MSALPSQPGKRSRKNTATRIQLPKRPQSAELESSPETPSVAEGVIESEEAVETIAEEQPVRAAVTPLWRDALRAAAKLLAGIGGSIWIFACSFFKSLRRHPAHTTFSLLLLAIISLLAVTGAQIHEDLLLSKVSDSSVEKIVEASKYTRNFTYAGEKSRGKSEFLRVGAPVWIQKEAVKAVLFHARKAGLSIEDQAVLLATVEVESGFNPSARADTTSACGLFQFVKATGDSFNLSQSDCMNPWLNARAGVAHFVKNYQRSVESKIEGLTGPERVFRTYELTYYLHHDGPNATRVADSVKATVVSGTQFLFKAYRILLEEGASRQKAPTFFERFSNNFFNLVQKIMSVVAPESAEYVAKLQVAFIPEVNSLRQ
jgi:hypothetical protein